jgi:hypothetical protein
MALPFSLQIFPALLALNHVFSLQVGRIVVGDTP